MRFFKLIFYAAIGVGLFVTLLNLYVYWYSAAYCYKEVSAVTSTKVVLILGASVYRNGTLSPMLEDRVLAGFELYRLNRVDKILISGDRRLNVYDEVSPIRNYLLKKGVRPQDIFTDYAGFDTYKSCYRAQKVFQVNQVVIATQAFHLPRAVYLARKQGLQAVGIAADQRPYRTQSKATLRECLARVKAFLEAELLRPQLGLPSRQYLITGDGRKSW
jgi:vancomycin permeability regulator SanA